jgi:hypothetical protein
MRHRPLGLKNGTSSAILEQNKKARYKGNIFVGKEAIERDVFDWSRKKGKIFF